MPEVTARSVLVVEDQGIIAEDIAMSLERLGYLVSGKARSAEEAVRAVEKAKPDLVLMDIQLRGAVDGIEATRQIKERCDIPVIYLTSHSDEGTLARAKETSPHGYLLKPFHERDLRTAIEVALRKHELEVKLAERERWFSTTLQSIGDAVIATDRNEVITFINKVAENLTGWRREDAIGKNVFEVFQVVDTGGSKVESPVGRAIRSRFAVQIPAESKLIARSGSGIDVDDSAAPILDHRGALLGGVVVFRDITARKDLERRLAQSERLASIGTLAAGVAHEINNPLAVVVANVEYVGGLLGALRARLELLPDGAALVAELGESMVAIGEAAEAADRVRRIVFDLKKLSRTDAVDAVPVDLPAAIDAALRMTENQLRHSVDLKVHLGTTPFVAIDEGRVVQVLVNLIMNAIQAVDPTRPNAEVAIVTRTDAAGRGVVQVIDTGVGIAARDLPRVFDPFFTTKPVGEGTGLGLALSHGIVAAAGGELTIESKVGRGTTVTLALPPASGRPSAPPPTTIVERTRARVLLVDDEPKVARAIERLIGSVHTVVLASDPRKALSLIGSGDAFDVILCDLMMPEMSGVDVYRALDSSSPALAARMAFLSGGAFTPEVDRFVAGFAGFVIDKPCTRDELLLIIEKIRSQGVARGTAR